MRAVDPLHTPKFPTYAKRLSKSLTGIIAALAVAFTAANGYETDGQAPPGTTLYVPPVPVTARQQVTPPTSYHLRWLLTSPSNATERAMTTFPTSLATLPTLLGNGSYYPLRRPFQRIDNGGAGSAPPKMELWVFPNTTTFNAPGDIAAGVVDNLAGEPRIAYNMGRQAETGKRYFIYPWLSPTQEAEYAVNPAATPQVQFRYRPCCDSTTTSSPRTVTTHPSTPHSVPPGDIVNWQNENGQTEYALRLPDTIFAAHTLPLHLLNPRNSNTQCRNDLTTATADATYHGPMTQSGYERLCRHRFFGGYPAWQPSFRSDSIDWQNMVPASALIPTTSEGVLPTGTAQQRLAQFGLLITIQRLRVPAQPSNRRCFTTWSSANSDLQLTCGFNKPGGTITEYQARLVDSSPTDYEYTESTTCFSTTATQPSCTITYTTIENSGVGQINAPTITGGTYSANQKDISFQVRARNAYRGGGSDGWGAWATTTVIISHAAGLLRPDTVTARTTPGFLITTWAGSSSSANHLATTYDIEYKLASASSWTRLARNGCSEGARTRTASACTISVAPGTYDVRVRSVGNNDAWFSDWSRTATSTTVATAAATAPTNFVAQTGNGIVTLTWDQPNPQHTASYTLRYRIVGANAWTTDSPAPTHSPTQSGTHTHVVSGLTNGETYEFELTAVGRTGANPTVTVTASPRAGVSGSFIFDLEVQPPTAPTAGAAATADVRWDVVSTVFDADCPGTSPPPRTDNGTSFNVEIEYRSVLDDDWTAAAPVPLPRGIDQNSDGCIVYAESIRLYEIPDLQYETQYFIRARGFTPARTEPWHVTTYTPTRYEVNIVSAQMVITRQSQALLTASIHVSTDPAPEGGASFEAFTDIAFRFSTADDEKVGQAGGLQKTRTFTASNSVYTTRIDAEDIGSTAQSMTTNPEWRFTLYPLSDPDNVWSGARTDWDIASATSPPVGQSIAVIGSRQGEQGDDAPSIVPAPRLGDIEVTDRPGDTATFTLGWSEIQGAERYRVRLDTTGVLDTVTRPHGNTQGFFGTATTGHFIDSPTPMECLPTGCEQNPATPTPPPSASLDDDHLHFGTQHFPLAAVYVHKARREFVLVVLGDMSDVLLGSNAPWFGWQDTTTRQRRGQDQNFLIDAPLSPAHMLSIKVENIPTGAWGYTARTPGTPAPGYAVRTVVRYNAPVQVDLYDRTPAEATAQSVLSMLSGSFQDFTGVSGSVSVLQGEEGIVRVRAIHEDGRYSNYSEPKRGIAVASPFSTETPNTPFPDPDLDDLGIGEIISDLRVTNPQDPTQTDIDPFAEDGRFSASLVVKVIAIAITVAVTAATWMLTANNPMQARVMVMIMLGSTTWMLTAPTIGNFGWGWVFTPMVLAVALGMMALARRAG